MSEADPLAPKRRLEPRLYGLYPLPVRVKNAAGQVSTFYTLADNICSSGLYFQSPDALPINTGLFVLIQLPKGIKMAVRGYILRHEPRANNLTGMAMRFSQTRIIPLLET